jgi:TDG/mug DNA glycosylase family protein
VVKRPTPRAGELSKEEFAEGARDLLVKLETFRPRIACFQGMMGFRPFFRVLAPALPAPLLGEQAPRLGETRLFVVPSPSPANAHASPSVQTEWFDRLAAVARS